ncbi:hypothetical protein [Phosphitispora sp. TUW77]|uniref:hypothetical protein n=1 Tax=Phosphitispora sp. TUW77 TaxID=3152361 RepID=UPI003AB1E9EB
MKIKGIRVYVVVVVLAVTLGILLTIQYVYQKYNVEQPLFKIYSDTKLVDDVKIDNEGVVPTVTLNVRKTEDLKDVYLKLNSYTEEIFGHNQFQIELKDKRTKELSEIYYNSQYVIYEAMANGDFTKMAAEVQENARNNGAKARVFIDNANIYISFIKDDKYLYEVIPRNNAALEVPGMLGSGI